MVLALAACCLFAGTVSATPITASVTGTGGTSYVQFSLPATTTVTFSPTVESGFTDPCLNSQSSCSFSIYEQVWIPGINSLTFSETVFCLSQGNCSTSQSQGLGGSVQLSAGLYEFVLIVNDSANTGIQSVTGTLDIAGDFTVLPEPPTSVMMATGMFAFSSFCAVLRRRRS